MDRCDAIHQIKEAHLADKVADETKASARQNLKAAVRRGHIAAGLSYREIARLLGFHRNTVESWFPKPEEKN